MDPELVTVAWATSGVVVSCGLLMGLTALLCKLSQYCHRRVRKMLFKRQRRHQEELRQDSKTPCYRRSQRKTYADGDPTESTDFTRGVDRMSPSATRAPSRQAAFDVPSIELDYSSSSDSRNEQTYHRIPKRSAIPMATGARIDCNPDDWPPIAAATAATNASSGAAAAGVSSNAASERLGPSRRGHIIFGWGGTVRA